MNPLRRVLEMAGLKPKERKKRLPLLTARVGGPACDGSRSLRKRVAIARSACTSPAAANLSGSTAAVAGQPRRPAPTPTLRGVSDRVYRSRHGRETEAVG